MKRFVRRFLKYLKTAEHWLTAKVALSVLYLLRLLPADAALNFADKAARRIGPMVGRHRVAIDNLRRAYPDKLPAEIEAIASDMWANMARLAVEYVFLDQLFDFDPQNEEAGRVEVEGIEIFLRLREEDKPHIFFTGHLGNFEFLPIAAATFDLKLTSLFRAPDNPYVAEYIHKTRKGTMGQLLASRAGAALQLARVLDEGGNIGALVDQKFNGGIPTTFFGRPCLSSPLVPKLARHYDCEIYPARCIRLANGRYRLEVMDKIELPRDISGAIDVDQTAQLLNDVVEEWVREDPGQWMWFHKRWQIR